MARYIALTRCAGIIRRLDPRTFHAAGSQRSTTVTKRRGDVLTMDAELRARGARQAVETFTGFLPSSWPVIADGYQAADLITVLMREADAEGLGATELLRLAQEQYAGEVGHPDADSRVPADGGLYSRRRGRYRAGQQREARRLAAGP